MNLARKSPRSFFLLNTSSQQFNLGVNKWGFVLWIEFLSREVDMKQIGPPLPHMYATEHKERIKYKHLMWDSKSCLNIDAKYHLMLCWLHKLNVISSSGIYATWKKVELSPVQKLVLILSMLPLINMKPSSAKVNQTGLINKKHWWPGSGAGLMSFSGKRELVSLALGKKL